MPVFSMSLMGRFAGFEDTAFPFIQQIITNNAGPLADKQVLYTPVCNEQGGIIDDILVYKWHEKHFVLVVNCANAEKDLTWLQKQAASYQPLVISDLTDRVSLLAIQGPQS